MSYYTIFVITGALSLCFVLYLLFQWVVSKLNKSEGLSPQAYQQTLQRPDDQTDGTSVDQNCLFARMGVTDEKAYALFTGDMKTFSPYPDEAAKKRAQERAAARDHEDKISALSGMPGTSIWHAMYDDD